MNVLIVEDSQEIVNAITFCLQFKWPDVVIRSVTEGRQWSEVFPDYPFDVVILDLNLPDIDGLDVLQQIRSASDVPVIIVTVRGRDVDKEKGMKLGATDYIVKPFAIKDFLARIEKVLQDKKTPHNSSS